nr:putative transposase (putative), gypsy type [Tanacetum cinerariifolium]
MGRDTVQLETAVSTISQEYLLEFTSKYGISEALRPELPGPEDRIVDFPEGKVGVYIKFFEVANFRLPLSQFLFDILGYYQIHLSQLSVIGATKQEAWEKYPAVLYQALRLSKKLEQPLLLGGREGVPNYRGLAYKFSKRWDASREYIFPRGCENTGHTSYPNPETTKGATLLSRAKPQILLGRRVVSLIRAPNPTKVKTISRPRATHEVPLLTITGNRVIKMEDPAAATDSPGVPSTIERSPLDFANENPSQQSTGPEDQETAAPVVLPSEDVPTMRGAPEAGPAERVAATDPPAAKERAREAMMRLMQTRPLRSSKGAAAAGDPESENTSFAFMVGSPESIYRPEWGITNGSMLDTPEACQDLVDHVAPPGYFSELRHLHNDHFLKQYNANLARHVAIGSQLRLRFEQEANLLKKSVAQVARRDKRIQARENEIKNLETLLEAEANMKKDAKDKSAKLSQELENMRALFSDLRYEENRVEQRCAEMDARLDALSIDFDKELYPHMLIAIAGRRRMIGHGLRLAVIKCGKSIELRQAFADVVSAGIAKGMSEGLKHAVEHGQAQLDLEDIEAYDPEAEAKYIAALKALKYLKYPLVDQLEGLKDAPMDVIMASLHLESDTGDDAPQWVRELHPTDAITANISRAEKKKKCRMVCRTPGVGSAHHARSDGVPVSVPIVVPQALAILLADAATQTETSYEASQLLRSSSLPVMHC